MPHNEPVSILIVNESAEEIKLTTLSFRGFFPNCRIEAVYSLEEAFQWAHRASWHLILIDDRLHAHRSSSILPELKRFAPHATLVLQTDRTDTSAALSAVQDGADFLLYKKSPAFLTELMLYTKGLIETHRHRMMLEQIQERHSRLTELLPDLLYEVNQAGRFVYVSPLTSEILGYTQDELIGAPFSIIVPPDQLDHARHCFNDRRTGSRATRENAIDLIGKTIPEAPAPPRITVRISAKGLYDSERRYFGTLGLLHMVNHGAHQESPVRCPDHPAPEVDRLLSLASRYSAASRRLSVSYHAIHGQSKTLAKALRIKALRESHLIEQVESLTAYAAEAMQLGDELVRATEELGVHRESVNDIIDAVLSAEQAPLAQTDHIERIYASGLPPFRGDVDGLKHVIGTLLSYANRHIPAGGNCRRFRISTAMINPDDGPADPKTTHPLPKPQEFEIGIQGTHAVAAMAPLPLQTNGDLTEAHALITRLGGRWDILPPHRGQLSIKIWIPVQSDSNPLDDRAISPSCNSSSEAPITSSRLTPSPPKPSSSQETSHRAIQSLPDRRKHARTAVNLPTQLIIGNSLRQAAMTELSPSGASLEVEGVLPLLAQQAVQLIFKTVAGSFEIQATTRNQEDGSKNQEGPRQTTRLLLHFSSLSDNQQKVLSSYIEEARTRVLAVTVEALFSPETTTESRNTVPEKTRQRGIDHRETMRVSVTLPTHIEVPSHDSSTARPIGMVINVSRGGACIQTSFPFEKTDEIIALHFSSTSVHNQPRVHEPEAPEAILVGRIVHRTPDNTVPPELKSGPSQPGMRIGIQFVRSVPFAEREINRVIAQHIGTSMDLSGRTGRSSIISTRRECRNARHQVIAITDDHARDQISPGTPIILIVPGFGLTQTDYLPLAYYLAANRIRVLRYDHTNHVGQSDGDIQQITLRGMQTDLQNVLDFIHTTWPTASVAILAEDIAARVAVKVMARSKSPCRLFLLNPVLDIETALKTPARPDAIGGYRKNPRQGIVNLWGLNVNFDQFVGDVIAGEYTNIASSAADFARLPIQPVILTSPRSNQPLEHIFGPQHHAIRAIGISPVVIPLQADVSGESNTYDERHVMAFRIICKLITAPTIGDQASSQMQQPPTQDVHQQRRLEEERIRIRHHISQATRNGLSVAYVTQLPQFGHLPDYWTLINELHRRLLPLEPGMTVLDIGCGVGDFVRAMLTNHVYRSAHQNIPPTAPLRYVGLDQSLESLELAQQQIQTFAQELLGTLKATVPVTQFVETHWLQTDWASPFPFIDGSIDRILCQLVLPFASSPLACLRQALRVLHPDGTAVVTCVQPHTDLSTLFQRHFRSAGHDESNSQTQIALHFLSRVREAIRHGILHSYERNELGHLLSHAGAGQIQIYPVLNNQLLLAIVRKAKSTG